MSVEQRPSSPGERYRLYLDESGDHVYRRLQEERHRYLCLSGCWFRGDDYRALHAALEAFKQKHLPHNPDEPIVLHREDIVNRRRAFWRLRDGAAREAFDAELLQLIADADFKVVAVVIDKAAVQANYPSSPAHPYHLAMGFMLQRFCGYLNQANRVGDVMAESRGGREDRLLKDSYARIYDRGMWYRSGDFFRQALATGELKVKPKKANIAGLQLADLLSNPLRKYTLMRMRRSPGPLPPFAGKVMDVAEPKFNRQLHTGQVEGYGYVLFPKQRRPAL
jgi:hypothetical protein